MRGVRCAVWICINEIVFVFAVQKIHCKKLDHFFLICSFVLFIKRDYCCCAGPYRGKNENSAISLSGASSFLCTYNCSQQLRVLFLAAYKYLQFYHVEIASTLQRATHLCCGAKKNGLSPDATVNRINFIFCRMHVIPHHNELHPVDVILEYLQKGFSLPSLSFRIFEWNCEHSVFLLLRYRKQILFNLWEKKQTNSFWLET